MVSFDLPNLEGSGRKSTLDGINHYCEVVWFQQFIGEVQPANANIHKFDFRRERPFFKPQNSLPAKSTVPKEDIPNPRHENAAHSFSTSSIRKKKRWPGFP